MGVMPSNMQIFVVIRANDTCKPGTLVRKFDDGFSEIKLTPEGKYDGFIPVIIPHEKLLHSIIPMEMPGQFTKQLDKVYHCGHESGDVRAAITEAVFAPPPEENEEDWEDYLE